MIDVKQLRDEVIRPVLKELGLHSDSAEQLLLGTVAQESKVGTYIKQLGKGPAVGIYQMEPATHDDIWKHYLSYKPELAAKVRSFLIGDEPNASEMKGNLYYATAMARIHYSRKPGFLPKADDVSGLAYYWKRFYNTNLGKGTEKEFRDNYNKYILPELVNG